MKGSKNLKHLFITTAAVSLLTTLAALAGCKHVRQTQAQGPSLEVTIHYMQAALRAHNGIKNHEQYLVQTWWSFSPERRQRILVRMTKSQKQYFSSLLGIPLDDKWSAYIKPPAKAGISEDAVAKLTADGCTLTYEARRGDITRLNLADIDTGTIKIDPEATDVSVVEFDTRDFNDSIRRGSEENTHGFFPLDDSATAQSFQKAFTHAVQLCGGHASTF